MKLLVVGIRQRNAPIAVREHFALGHEAVREALAYLNRQPEINECAIITTCNRTEFYLAAEDTVAAVEVVYRFFRDTKGINVWDYPKHVFRFMGEDAVIHLLRVAAGLDSLIVGEGQILNQVKDALGTAQQQQTVGRILDRVFKLALTTGKRVRTETGIATKDVSVSRAAYQLAKRLKPNLLNESIALIGGGKMATLLMSSLKREMPADAHHKVVILNRSEARLKELTDQYGFRGVGWHDIETVLQEASVLFVATGAPHTLLHHEDFVVLDAKLVIDISMPRNVHPTVGQLAHIDLYNTDDLAGITAFTPETEAAIVGQAQHIIREECDNFTQWYHRLSVYPTIVDLRAKVEAIRQDQLASLRGVSDEHHSHLDKLSKSLVNKILHEPIASLKTETCPQSLTQKAAVVRTLFNILPQPAQIDTEEVHVS